MKLPRDLSGAEVARRLARHYCHRVTRSRGSHMTVTRRLVPAEQREGRLRDRLHAGFHKPKPMRTLTEIRADTLALERETEGLLEKIVGCRA